VDGPLIIVRFGTCGGASRTIVPGSICVADEAALITRNYDEFHRTDEADGDSRHFYHITNATACDGALSDIVTTTMEQCLRAHDLHGKRWYIFCARSLIRKIRFQCLSCAVLMHLRTASIVLK
jgi:hypothetical protein